MHANSPKPLLKHVSESRLTSLLLKAKFFLVRQIRWRFKPPRFFVLLGAPGAGKGTLANFLSPALQIAQLSTGDVFRRELANNTQLGQRVKKHISDGTLVPDELTFAILQQELSDSRYWKGAVLDGFPRTVAQAYMLEQLFRDWGISLERVILLEVDESDLLDRLSNRRVCSNRTCGRSYNLKSELPREPGKCDVCHSALHQRADDVPEVILERLRTYRTATKPLCVYYQDRNVLAFVKPTAGMTPQEVFASVTTALTG